MKDQLIAVIAEKMISEAKKLTGDNIHKALIYFDKLHFAMDNEESDSL